VKPATLSLEAYVFPRGTSYVLRAPDGVTAVYRTFNYAALLNWLRRHGYEITHE
jgi:hypothetical protein